MPRTTARRLARLAAAPLLLAALAGCGAGGGGTPQAGGGPERTPAPSGAPTTAGHGVPLAQAIGTLRVAAEHHAGYERDDFELWDDADHDGCDTRQEILMSEAVRKPEEGPDCRLTGGEWRSGYDGRTTTDASGLDIDHVVPLAEAWDSGAYTWSAAKRERYANDLGAARSLAAVSAHSNRSKGDRDVAEWLPPARSARCRYVADWTGTKLRWGLRVDRAEQAALRREAARCPDATVSYRPAR